MIPHAIDATTTHCVEKETRLCMGWARLPIARMVVSVQRWAMAIQRWQGIPTCTSCTTYTNQRHPVIIVSTSLHEGSNKQIPTQQQAIVDAAWHYLQGSVSACQFQYQFQHPQQDVRLCPVSYVRIGSLAWQWGPHPVNCTLWNRIECSIKNIWTWIRGYMRTVKISETHIPLLPASNGSPP